MKWEPEETEPPPDFGLDMPEITPEMEAKWSWLVGADPNEGFSEADRDYFKWLESQEP